MTIIRPGHAKDLPELLAIYNHFVESTPVTFDVEPRSLEEREQWLTQFAATGPHRLLVAEDGGAVVGYASSTRFRRKAAYATTVETSVYVVPDSARRGFGRGLYTTLFEILGHEDVHRAVAALALPNDASVAFHKTFGFREVGVFTESGRKFDRYWDIMWMEKSLP